MNREGAEVKLKHIFGLNSFYDDQWSVIQKLFNGERILLIEKTGYGKSLCYQFPATQLEGLTIVFSPLLALMRDQIKFLASHGIAARSINSEQTEDENERVIQDAKQNKIKILYIAPERQENRDWLDAVRNIKISMVVIDEAHCISVWGHDFRPAYRRIINLVKLIPQNFPVLATTATATQRVADDILEQIGGKISLIRGNLLRDNFQLNVIKVKNENEKLEWIGEMLPIFEGSGLIYTGTRNNTEIFSKWLQYIGISSINYNAGLEAALRIEIEKGFMDNRWKCVVATNALGMGIDKPDIRFIIHTQFPGSPIHYYQEIGRAGRDDKKTTIYLLYNPDDVDLQNAFIDGSKPSVKNYFKVIDALKKEPLGEHDLMRKTNLKQTQIRVIRADLLDQVIIKEVL
ncbi:MAG: RecQ family ATP-dependent DNA helicase, partial [Bacteroidota bacterium]